MSYLPQQQPKRSSSNMKALIIVAAVLAVICGCLGCAGYLGYVARQKEKERPAAAAVSTSPSARVTKSPAAGVKYATAAAVMKAMNAKGIGCTGYKTIPIELYDPRALQSAFCKTVDGAELNVSIYANSADARTSTQRLHDLPGQSGYGSIGTYGENWAIHVSYDWRTWITYTAKVMGSNLVEIPPKK